MDCLKNQVFFVCLPQKYKLVFDTSYDRRYKDIEGIDILFYETLWLKMPTFENGILLVVVSDYNSSKIVRETYPFSVKVPYSSDYDFVGISLIPTIKLNNSIHPLLFGTIPIGFEVFEIYAEIYSLGTSSHGAIVNIYNNDNVIYHHKIEPFNGVVAFKYLIYLEKVNYGNIDVVVQFDNGYMVRESFVYVFDNERAGRIINALKLVTAASLWKNYFKDVGVSNRVAALLRFVDEMAKKDRTFIDKWNEFLLRFDYAERFFVEGSRRGYETDRGHILIVYGWPDDIQVYSNLEYRIYRDLMVWVYYFDDLIITFERFGVGDTWRVKPFVSKSTKRELKIR